jgi:prevent-host-death family protein
MSTITATDAKNKFGQVLDEAQHEPVHVQKNGRDVAVVISAAEYQRLRAASEPPKVNPRLEALIDESMTRWGEVYKALAK